jgi:hypothetical protein
MIDIANRIEKLTRFWNVDEVLSKFRNLYESYIETYRTKEEAIEKIKSRYGLYASEYFLSRDYRTAEMYALICILADVVRNGKIEDVSSQKIRTLISDVYAIERRLTLRVQQEAQV